MSSDKGELGGVGLGPLAPKVRNLIKQLSDAIVDVEFAQDAIAACKTRLLSAENVLEMAVRDRDRLYHELVGALDDDTA